MPGRIVVTVVTLAVRMEVVSWREVPEPHVEGVERRSVATMGDDDYGAMVRGGPERLAGRVASAEE